MTANEQKGPFWGDENVLNLNCGDGCTTLYVSSKSLNCPVR